MAPATPPSDRNTAVVLTVAGSDSGGGAGVQADLKTFARLGVFGTSAVTCVTAQNPQGVSAVHAVPVAVVAEQMGAVFAAFPVRAVKTGMLYSAEIVRVVADVLAARKPIPLVVDPVMTATSGATLLRDAARAAMVRRLLPLAAVVTPNLAEAGVLAGMEVHSLARMREAARRISGEFGTACVVKGGHRTGGEVRDVLCADGRIEEFSVRRVRVRETHGTGCTFSAALAAYLALGSGLSAAVQQAQAYVRRALAESRSAGRYAVLGW